MSNVILTAAWIAEQAHCGQKRKYSNTPYVTHPARVAARVSRFADEHIVAAAWCHDVLEDSTYPYEALVQGITSYAAELVQELTAPKSDLPRGERKRLQLEKAAASSLVAKWIKLADRADNLQSLTVDLLRNPDPAHPVHQFARLYLPESIKLIHVLRHAHVELAGECLDAYHECLSLLR